jgi:hypothetical protein
MVLIVVETLYRLSGAVLLFVLRAPDVLDFDRRRRRRIERDDY